MLKNTTLIFVFIFIFCFVLILPLVSHAEEPFIRVLLTIEKNTITFEHKQGVELLDSLGNKIAKQNILTVRPVSNGLLAVRLLSPEKSFEDSIFFIRPLSNLYPTVINGKRAYRGGFFVKKEEQQLFLINYVAMEEYVAGVVGGEVSSRWPIEALKAQAVIARTYAAKKALERKSFDYDLVDTVKDQVYVGVLGEELSVLRAIADTRSEILLHDEEIITAYYHADCGGKTEFGSNVFPGQLPYLVSVSCPFGDSSPYKNWSKVITKDELLQTLKLAGYSFSGETEEVEFIKNNMTGRIEMVRFFYEGGVVEIYGKVFRNLIGTREMRSTNADLNVMEKTTVVRKIPVKPQFEEDQEQEEVQLVKDEDAKDLVINGVQNQAQKEIQKEVTEKDNGLEPASTKLVKETKDMKLVKKDMKLVKKDMKLVKKDMKLVKKDMKLVKIDMKLVKIDMKLVKKDMKLVKIKEEKEVIYKIWEKLVAPISQNINLVFAAENGSLAKRSDRNQNPFLVIGKDGKWIRRWDFHAVYVSSKLATKHIKFSYTIVKEIAIHKNLNLRKIKSKEKKENNSKSYSIIVKKVPTLFKITGHGWGHGVGLCQWGSKGMAERGYNYKEILQYYYKNIKIVKI